LTLKACDNAQNSLKIIDNQPDDGVKKKFVVCTKPLTLTRTNRIQFIEWVEMLKILGADQVYVYHRYFHRELFRVARYYEKQGFMVLQQFLEPSGASRAKTHNYNAQMSEMSIYNDCFYKVKNLFEYVVVIDHDEIIVPNHKDDKTWSDMINRLKDEKGYDSYAFQWVTYHPNITSHLRDVPSYYYMLQHVRVKYRPK
jgi:hypothetical protein